MNIFTNNHSRTVTYQADIQASGNWYLSLYGWTKSPLIEFYVVEAFGSYDPSSAATSVGTAEIDGSTYTLLQTTRTNQPSIEGTSTFQQYWAVRKEHRTSGSIDFGAHIDAWKGAGLDLGSFDYMILATEGYKSSGSSTVTVS
jgi:endo-1,4-beta-xylanase